jgi:hypothetical protein
MQSALKDQWKEGQERRVILSDHEPEALEGYINWLYTKEVTLKNAEENCKHHDTSSNQEAQDSDCSHKHSLELVKMYVLGYYLNDMQFCNAVIDTMVLMRGCTPGLSTITWVWDHTMQDCPIRKYILEQWAGTICNAGAIEILRNQSPKVPRDFLIDLLAFTGAKHRSEVVKTAIAGERVQIPQENGRLGQMRLSDAHASLRRRIDIHMTRPEQ